QNWPALIVARLRGCHVTLSSGGGRSGRLNEFYRQSAGPGCSRTNFGFVLRTVRRLQFCSDTFSSREPVSTSLENALDWTQAALRMLREGFMATVDGSLVAHLPMFAGFGADELADILREARSTRYAKNSTVFEEGQDAHSFFLLLHGHIRAGKTTPAGEQVVVRYVAPGEIFGVAPAMGFPRYPATATAVDDSVVLSWPAAAWPRLVARFPALAANTLQAVGSRLQESHTRVVEMSTQQVEQRIAHA